HLQTQHIHLAVHRLRPHNPRRCRHRLCPPLQSHSKHHIQYQRDALLSLITERGYNIVAILKTHAHANHLTSARYLQQALLRRGTRPASLATWLGPVLLFATPSSSPSLARRSETSPAATRTPCFTLSPPSSTSCPIAIASTSATTTHPAGPTGAQNSAPSSP